MSNEKSGEVSLTEVSTTGSEVTVHEQVTATDGKVCKVTVISRKALTKAERFNKNGLEKTLQAIFRCAVRGSFLNVKCLHSGINSGVAEFFLYSQKLVVFSNSFGSGRCAGLDLAGVQSHREIGDGGIRRFTRAV